MVQFEIGHEMYPDINNGNAAIYRMPAVAAMCWMMSGTNPLGAFTGTGIGGTHFKVEGKELLILLLMRPGDPDDTRVWCKASWFSQLPQDVALDWYNLLENAASDVLEKYMAKEGILDVLAKVHIPQNSLIYANPYTMAHLMKGEPSLMELPTNPNFTYMGFPVLVDHTLPDSTFRIVDLQGTLRSVVTYGSYGDLDGLKQDISNP